jgi:hypothetical protein
MTFYRVRLLMWVVMVMCSGAARADLYGFVDGDRVSVIFSDTQPADARYKLFSKNKPGQITETQCAAGRGRAGALAIQRAHPCRGEGDQG